MSNYLRNRPFLCVEFSYVPSKSANTSEKNWMLKDDAVTTLNKVSVVDRIKTKNELKSAIIIDVIYSKIVKNNTNFSDEAIVEKYMSEYSETILRAIDTWSRKAVGNEAVNSD